MIRSVSSWSAGFLDPDTVEQSIHEAYVDTITKAQHYVYIENQFFITLSRTSVTVRNQVRVLNYLWLFHTTNYVHVICKTHCGKFPVVYLIDWFIDYIGDGSKPLF